MLLVMSGLTVRAQYAQGDPLITSGERNVYNGHYRQHLFYIDSSKQLKPADAAQLRFAPLTRFLAEKGSEGTLAIPGLPAFYHQQLPP